MMRLETVSKEVADRLRGSNATQQRTAVLIACAMALQDAGVENPDVLIAFKQLQESPSIALPLWTRLNELVSILDERYFFLQDKEDADAMDQKESIRLFSQARAIAALSYAGIEMTVESAMEAIYEASVAVEDGSKIFERILFVL